MNLWDASPEWTPRSQPSRPFGWSVVIKLTKIARGEALRQIEVDRLTRLKALLRELVGRGKLLCPEADQEEEYIAERLDRDVHGEFAVLSLGISLRHRQGIFDYQVYCGMKARVQKAEVINVPLSAYFHSDRIELLEEARNRSFVIKTNLFKDAELLGRKDAAKAEVGRRWKELRQQFVAQRRKYDEQLQEEQRGYADAMMQMIQEVERKSRSGLPDFWDIMGVQGFLGYKAYWRQLGG